MKRLLRASTFILLGFSGLGLGVIAVRASTDCERFVKVIAHAPAKHHKYSTDTLAKWAAWNKAHPNYHPKKLTPKETWEKVAFACQVPIEPAEVADLALPTLDVPDMQFPPSLFPPDTPLVVPAPNVPQQLTTEALLVPPAYTPEVPTLLPPTGSAVTPPPVVTPEPGSLLLTATGCMALLGLAWRKRIQALRVRR
jgi:hypothetical protein